MASAEMDKSSLEALIKWLEIWSAVFGVLVVVGVAGESFFGIRLLWNSWKLQQIQSADNARLLSDVAQANARAEEAKRDATVANLELSRIERRFAPRRLSFEEKKRIAAKLGEFAPRSVTIVEARFDDPEEKDFVIDLVHIFNEAHWESRITTDPQHISRTLTGLLIMINEDEAVANSQLSRAASCLVNALLSESIFVQGPLSTPRAFKGSQGPSIMVIVGAKPDFPKESN